MTPLLLVEDELFLGKTLRIALSKLGFEVIHVTTIAEARLAISRADSQKKPFSTIVLDVMLPDGDGISFCHELRTTNNQTPVLMLTARGAVEDRVLGLRAGADDYLAKPFNFDELAARLEALLRRSKPNASVEKEHASVKWNVDPERLRIEGPKGWITLTPLEYKLANRLMSASGAIVSRSALLKEVWGFSLLPKTRTVDHFVGRLRKYFELDPENPEHFITVRGAGYRFEPVKNLRD